MVDLRVVIPARFESSRFPGKPLADLAGTSVLHRCIYQCLETVSPEALIVATDDERILRHCEHIGVRVEMTREDCPTGTDRVAEVASRTPADWFVNVQGDEPFISPLAVQAVMDAARRAPTSVGAINAYSPILTEEDFRSATVPKVVARPDGRLMYISRAAIPTTKSLGFEFAHRQVGLYAFRSEVLADFAATGTKGVYEELEDVEILRLFDIGADVQMIEVEQQGMAIDTPEDLARAHQYAQEIADRGI